MESKKTVTRTRSSKELMKSNSRKSIISNSEKLDTSSKELMKSNSRKSIISNSEKLDTNVVSIESKAETSEIKTHGRDLDQKMATSNGKNKNLSSIKKPVTGSNLQEVKYRTSRRVQYQKKDQTSKVTPTSKTTIGKVQSKVNERKNEIESISFPTKMSFRMNNRIKEERNDLIRKGRTRQYQSIIIQLDNDSDTERLYFDFL
ncbi:hypothetical protein DICVIV_08578 [Dictyocaulus viviparus]|uniref:Uncharacterized protein n=1 Tax=Dictyocaulus viviparus TaxID=29172 RepID=A0A0D8XLG0_DICVI|nr:hypothetical protein DICVIV_08578 [Dictyocaulus viviparus]